MNWRGFGGRGQLFNEVLSACLFGATVTHRSENGRSYDPVLSLASPKYIPGIYRITSIKTKRMHLLATFCEGIGI
jgi:hypothetical protein